MAEIIQFPRPLHAVARPPKLVRGAMAAGALVLATASALELFGPADPLRPAAWTIPVILLGAAAWLLWYCVRCRLEVRPGEVQFFGFLPSQPVRFAELEEITVVEAPVEQGRFDRSHLRLRRRGQASALKLSLSWEGAADVVEALEKLVPGQVQHEEAS